MGGISAVSRWRTIARIPRVIVVLIAIKYYLRSIKNNYIRNPVEENARNELWIAIFY